MIKYNTC